MLRSVSSRVAPAATPPGRSGEYAEKFAPASSMMIRKRCMRAIVSTVMLSLEDGEASQNAPPLPFGAPPQRDAASGCRRRSGMLLETKPERSRNEPPESLIYDGTVAGEKPARPSSRKIE